MQTKLTCTVAFRSGARFPRAWLEPPRSRKACALRGLKAHAIPAGVERLHSKQ